MVDAWNYRIGASAELSLVATTSGGTLKANGEIVATFSGIERYRVESYSGDDVVRTFGGNDSINVSTGANSVKSGGGADFVRSLVSEANVLLGGSGRDTLQIDSPLHGLVIFDALEGRDAYGSTIKGFETFIIRAGSKDDTIATRSGDDTLRLSFGNDTGIGRGGNDFLDGDNGHDDLYGGKGNDGLYGGNGRDRLVGGLGDDILGGGAGFDQLTGGEGNDTFVFERDPSTVDEITDFRTGQDKIEVNAYYLDEMLPSGPLDPARFHEGGPVGTEGQFVLVDEGTIDRLIWDANGLDAGGALQIMVLLGDSGLTAADVGISNF